MKYNHLGRSGIKVSQLSFGSWVTFSKQLEIKDVVESMSIAKGYGVNFFDNAEVYAFGKSEELMGEALKKLAWSRLDYLISTKFFWGIHEGVNSINTLNRKYLLESIGGSLKRLQLDHVDLVYCHRPDPHTPIEETVYAMHDMIQRGYALYWGTSEWSADEIRSAWSIAEKYGLHKPIVEQPQYNLLHRYRVETEYKRLYEEVGLGLTTWSPLASGVLTGKYLKSIPPNSRAAMKSMGFVTEAATDPNNKTKVGKLLDLANNLSCKPGPLAIAWCLKNKNVSTVITGASQIQQLHENMTALEVLPKLSDEVMSQLDMIFTRTSL